MSNTNVRIAEQDSSATESIGPSRSEQSEHRFRVTVVVGQDAGVLCDVEPHLPQKVLVGTGEACAMRLTDTTVSRRHCSLWVEGPLLRLKDLESTNGTMVNGMRTYDIALMGGEVVHVGHSELTIERYEVAREKQANAVNGFGRLVGQSKSMKRLYPVLVALAKHDHSVLIEGEAGTGKELLAEVIHEESDRRSGPFVVFDASTLPGADLHVALFGTASLPGAMEEADQGTLLIDEVSELPVALQLALAEWLSGRARLRSDGSALAHANVRIVVTSRRNLDLEVQSGRVSEALVRLLLTSRIELPPLSDRFGDILLLARHFWKRFAADGRSPPVSMLARLESRAWPGNIRELESEVAKLVGQQDESPGAVVSQNALASWVAGTSADLTSTLLEQDLPLLQARNMLTEHFDRLYIGKMLQRFNNNVTRAAASSGLARRNFQILRKKRGA
jgi:two-component system, NtrC family, response regulator HydG